MNGYLLDTNLLVALFWPAHSQHSQAVNWFAGNRKKGWSTCPFTQAGFVRVVSNPAFSRDAVAPVEAIRVLGENTKAKDHDFWPDDASIGETAQLLKSRLSGHQHVTDAYLLTLAVRRDGILVTFDRAIAALLPPGSKLERHLEVVDSQSR